MSKYETEYLKKAHKKSSCHKEELLESEFCGCFYCKKVFKPSEIEDWIEEDNSKETALCPYCYIDSVIGAKSGFPVTDNVFLEEMHYYWFIR